MIFDVEKYLFVGHKNDLDLFFQKAQKRGLIEFIPASKKKKVDLPESLKEIANAIKILKKQQIQSEQKEAKADSEVVREILKYAERESFLEDEKKRLEAEIARVKPLGHFSTKDVDTLANETGLKIQFFCIKSNKAHKVTHRDLIYLTTAHDLDYFINISKTLVTNNGLIELHVDQSYPELVKSLNHVQQELKRIHESLMRLTAYIDALQEMLVHELNVFHLHFAKTEVSTLLDVSLFSVEAYVPKNHLKTVNSLIKDFAVSASPIELDKNEKKPTYMENESLGRLGEDLVHIYDTPAPSDRDPSKWVLWFFALFFAMIVADGGYGFIYFCLGLILTRLWKKEEGLKKRFAKLILILGTTCTAWGVMTASFFGLKLAPESPLQKISILQFVTEKKADYHVREKDETYRELVEQMPQAKNASTGKEFLLLGTEIKDGNKEYKIIEDFNESILMEFSILIGIIHVILSLLRYGLRNVSGFGWSIAMVGAYLYFPKIVQSVPMATYLGGISLTQAQSLGSVLLIVGVAWAVIAALIQHRMGGLEEITKAIQIFADVLSYLRLYALGLAGMILAATFNEIAMNIGLIYGGFLIVIAGHFINMILGIMSGTIHGLRLNFLEWYHYSFEGGGKLFNPLKILQRSKT